MSGGVQPEAVSAALSGAQALLERCARDAEARAASWAATHLFGLPPALRAARVFAEGWLHGIPQDALTERTARYHARALRDLRTADWLDKMLGGPMWREAGCGTCRARLRADGSWDDWDLGDLAPPESRRDADRGVPVVTVPVYDGFEAVEIFAVELAPAATTRRVGRVFALTGLSFGLGAATPEFLEWRAWSTGVAIVASPLDWVRAHRVHAETGRVAALLDDMPAVWLAGIDADEALILDDELQHARDRFLIDSDPLICAGSDLAASVARRLDAARRAAAPPKGEVLVWTPDDANAAGAAA